MFGALVSLTQGCLQGPSVSPPTLKLSLSPPPPPLSCLWLGCSTSSTYRQVIAGNIQQEHSGDGSGPWILSTMALDMSSPHSRALSFLAFH